MDAPKISLCMITRDEEDQIGRCLESVQDLVDEIVLVDTGSTDRTIEIARSFGARVFFRSWDNDFSTPRNLSLDLATGDWILVLDADEAIDAADHRKIRKLVELQHVVYQMTQRHYTDNHCLSGYRKCKGEYPEWEKHSSGYFESSCVRLFPHFQGIHFEGRVHELVEHSISQMNRHTIVDSQIRIQHYGHLGDRKQRRNKDSLYTALGSQKLSESPNQWKAYYELGIEHGGNKKFEEAIKALVISSRLRPDYVNTWINLGYCLGESGKLKAAIKALLQAVHLDPNNDEAFCNLGVAWLRVHRFDKAIECFERAVEINQEYINAYNNLGLAYRYVGKEAEAVAAFRKALEILPDCAESKSQLADILASQKKFDEAESLLKEAISLKPDMAKAYYFMGNMLEELERASEAVGFLRKFVELEKERRAEYVPEPLAKEFERIEERCREMESCSD